MCSTFDLPFTFERVRDEGGGGAEGGGGQKRSQDLSRSYFWSVSLLILLWSLSSMMPIEKKRF